MTGPVPGDPPPAAEPTPGPSTSGGPAAGGSTAGGATSGGRPSGLRNPPGAMRALGAGTLVIEALVLLLAIQPIRVLGAKLDAVAVGVVVALAVFAVLLAGVAGRAWAWRAGAGLQVALLGAGFLHWSLAVLGLIFGALWAYVWHVRRTVLG